MASKQAQIIARTIKRLNLKRIISQNLLGNLRRSFAYEEPPASFRLKYPVDVYTIDGFKCVCTASSKNKKFKYHIMYFHGGSYTMPAHRAHWHMVDSILSRLNVELTFVNYPLLPEYSCTDAIKMITAAYNNIVKNYNENVILMGDSAGGGLAMSLSLYLDSIKSKIIPKKLVLLSPCLDVSAEDFISPALEKRDFILDKETIRIIGQKYAGDLDIKNYLCSPLYGNLQKLPEIALFIGTNDILYGQAEEFKKRMKRLKAPLSYYSYKDMHHVWMGYPIPEAKDAFDKIAEFIRRDSENNKSTSFYDYKL